MTQRNIVAIITDQLRCDFLPAYGCAAIDTPNLDRLAAMGVTFDRTIAASPVCGPARASMMTGRFPSDHGVCTNELPFRDGLDYMPQRMTDLGYATGCFGKMHHEPWDDVKGFQVARLMEGGRLGDNCPYLAWLKQRRPDVTRSFNTDHENCRFLFDEEDHYERWIASQAIDFIDQQSRSDEPFFAWVSFIGPHGPHAPPRELDGCVRTELLPPHIALTDEVRQRLAPVNLYSIASRPVTDPQVIARYREAYAMMIVHIDQQIGRILDTLEAQDQLDNTTLLFLADHGDMLEDHGLITKGPYPHHASLNVPMIVANHPAVAPGTRSDALANNLDVPGTILAIAGADRGIGQSRSLIDLASPSPKHPRAANFSELADKFKIVETDRYRMAFYPFCNHIELYDLAGDPKLTTNLANDPAHAATLATMLTHLVEFGIVAKGVRVEAARFVPEQQRGVERYDPNYRDDYPVAFPMHMYEVDLLTKAGFDATFNDFCKDRPVLAAYYPPYWTGKKP